MVSLNEWNCFLLDTDQDTRNWRRPPQVLKIKGKICVNIVLKTSTYFLEALINFFLLLNMHIALI